MNKNTFRRLVALVAALTICSLAFGQENPVDDTNVNTVTAAQAAPINPSENVGNLATKQDVQNLESQIQDVEHNKVFLDQVTHNVNLEQSHRSWAKAELAKTNIKLEALRKEHNNLKWMTFYGLQKHREELDKLETGQKANSQAIDRLNGAVYDPSTGVSRIDGLQGQVSSMAEGYQKHDGIIDKLVTSTNALFWWCLGLTAIVIVGFSRRYIIGRN